MNFFKDYKFFINIINHNKKEFNSVNYNNKKRILVEFNNFCSDHIALSYCSNILKRKFKADIYAYPGHILLSYPLKQNLINKIKFILGNFFKLKYFGVYKSFGTKKIFFPKPKRKIIEKADKALKIFISKVKTLKDLEKFKYKNVLIGDLLYDTYLKNRYDIIPTINLKSNDFLKFAFEFLILFEYWNDYIKNNEVKAIISSHSVYSIGILGRIGLKNNIESFVLTYDEFKRINKKNPMQGQEVKRFKEIFKNLNKSKKIELIKQSKNKINNRLLGKYSADYGYITKSPFGLGRKLKINKKKKKIFVIATHDFVDGPHALGNSIFPDFYQWFTNLCNYSNKSDDIWLVKNHPDFGDDFAKYIQYERVVTKNILKKFPKVRILHKNTTLNDLHNIKVDAVFTVNGTIAFDFALLGTPVANCSLNNPYINYNFNFHLKNESELKNFIFNFEKEKKKLKIKKYELYQCYGMRNIFFTRNWFFNNLDETTKEVGSYHKLHKPVFYNYWVKNFNNFDKEYTQKKIVEFIESKRIFLLDNQNFGNY